VWPFGVVEDPPPLDEDLGFPHGVEDFPVQALIPHSLPLKLSQYPFSQGLPGSM
jgi:hypothetical protein